LTKTLYYSPNLVLMEVVMFRYATLLAIYVTGLLAIGASALAAQYGTAEEARAMLDKAVTDENG
jgi:hypothetical protein